MLTSITPLGERGRGQRWAVTAGALTIGHLIGGAALGGLLALLAWCVAATMELSDPTITVVIAAGASVAVAGDLAGVTLPGRRQVDEVWLNAYRGWVYGLGFGVQLGMGFVTVVNTLLLPVMVLAAVLLGPTAAFAIGLVYGGGRAVMALLNARVRSVEQLKTLHRRLDGIENRVRFWSAGIVVAAGLAAVAT